MRLDVAELDVAQAATGVGAAHPAEELKDLTIQTSGTFVGSLDIETTVDGSIWVKAATGITAPGVTAIDGVHKRIRTNVTAYTSGQAVVHLAGLNHRTT